MGLRIADRSLGCSRARRPRGTGGTPVLLLDGDAFGEVAGFVDIAAAEDGDVVGE